MEKGKEIFAVSAGYIILTVFAAAYFQGVSEAANAVVRIVTILAGPTGFFFIVSVPLLGLVGLVLALVPLVSAAFCQRRLKMRYFLLSLSIVIWACFGYLVWLTLFSL